ncbi:L,D-transpeptidase [Candidatus Peregrinibacteria bacterium]|nr:L,D-transpeptidase [Candidatus Peregrinibacteria bacterium]
MPLSRDEIVVNREDNRVSFVHRNGFVLEVPGATGQRGAVFYLGHRYQALTPLGEWDAKSYEIKSDHVTFGEAGEFWRLFRNGKPTPYGIHDVEASGRWMQLPDDERFKTYGCIAMGTDSIALFRDTFEQDNHDVKVWVVANDEQAQAKIAEIIAG